MSPGLALAAIQVSFDPYFHWDSSAVRWETVGAAFAIFTGLAWAGLIAGRTPARRAARGEAAGVSAGVSGDDPTIEDDPEGPWHLRRDDLLFIVLGAIPGAIVLGRVGYGLLHADYYAAFPSALVDPAQGSLELTGAVVGGSISGAYVAALLDAPVGRWLHVAARPLLLVLILVKAAQALGGSGQGLPADLPWATAYLGPGPWGSATPELAAHPAQLYEALLAVPALLIVAALGSWTGLRRLDGRLFAIALGLWALARAAAAAFWRDDAVLGPLRAEQCLSLAVAVLAFSAAILATVLRRQPED